MTTRIMALTGAFSLAIAAAAAGQQPVLTTARGVYSAAQAAEGEVLYRGACASCHGENLMGTFEVPSLTGRFVGNWANGSVGTLFAYVSDAMPQMAPGTLSPEDNARIVAYLLKANGMPAGPQPLPADRATLDRIAFVPAGPPR